VRHNTSSTPFRSDVDLALERRGTMSDLAMDDRAAIVRVAELLGCPTAAAHIRDDARRRSLVHVAPDPAPRPGPRPQLTPPRTPLLRLHAGGAALEDADDLFWEDVRRLLGRHDEHDLSLPGAMTLDAMRMLLPEPA
jgi:hypothetical protein